MGNNKIKVTVSSINGIQVETSRLGVAKVSSYGKPTMTMTARRLSWLNGFPYIFPMIFGQTP